MPDNFIRLMQAFFLPAAEALQDIGWRPAVDVYRCSDGWLVKFELAGVRREDLELGVCGRHLILRGCRRDWVAEQGYQHHMLEISYSHFERGLDLPCNLELAQITTEYRDGLLLVRILTEN